jgi:hypothetical protein
LPCANAGAATSAQNAAAMQVRRLIIADSSWGG